MEKLAIVIVTYRRQALLGKLLESLLLLEDAPWRIFVIDNENSPETTGIVETYSRIAQEGLTAVPWKSAAETFVYVPMEQNTGGAGGFSEGVRLAYQAGAEWFWLMDDDVVVMPDAIAKLDRWTGDFDAIQGARLDFDGGPFYWQYRFIEPMGMYNPLASAKHTEAGYRPMNTICFEGGLFNRKIVEELGPPDPRFFIYWDDCIYGYLASKVGRCAVVEDVILQRTRELTNWEVTGVRQLNSSSNMTRYHVMRNRGHMANYMKQAGTYNPIGFELGTAACFAKELIRLATVDRGDFATGVGRLRDGWLDARAIMNDPAWQPIGPADLNQRVISKDASDANS